MILRQYFVAGEINQKSIGRILFFRQFSRSSWFRQSTAALADIQKDIAKDNGVHVTDLALTAFNRC
jgi:hypothetical protein